jgi:hypothetical protein
LCHNVTAAPIVSGKTGPEDANVKKWVLRTAMTFALAMLTVALSRPT